MKMILIILFLALCSPLVAPFYPVIYIPIPDEINAYTSLINAVVKVESNNGKYLFNEKEGAIGWFQIRECRIRDFNKRTGKNYSHSEMYDYAKSKEVFLYYCQDRDFEKIAKSWNGSGPMTNEYWEKIKSIL